MKIVTDELMKRLKDKPQDQEKTIVEFLQIIDWDGYVCGGTIKKLWDIDIPDD